MNEIDERDKIFIDMYADIKVIKEGVGKLEKLVNEHTVGISDIKKDMHAVKMSGRLIKWIAGIIGAIVAIAVNYLSNTLGNN